MTSRPTPNFWKAFMRLGMTERRAAVRAYETFVADPAHPSLHFKKLKGLDDHWSVRVTLDVRAVGLRDGDAIYWNWIGHHGDFDSRFG